MTEIVSVHLNKEASNVFLYDAKTAPETVIRKTVKTGINDMKVFKIPCSSERVRGKGSRLSACSLIKLLFSIFY